MILATKFYAPRARPGAVPREHLAARLEADVRPGGLGLVAAPAGFGKTTAVVQWLTQRERTYAWLSLDATDDDPERFWAHVVAALERLWPGAGADAGPLIGAAPADGAAVADALVNGIVQHGHGPEPGRPAVLVLDDYHVIRSLAIHQGVNHLLDHLPPALAVVIATREDPPLSLARRRARGMLAEVRAADLRFSAEEAATFLTGTMGLALTAADVEALERRTEGWIASLHLAALSLQRHEHPAAFIRAFTGADRYVVDYLMEEVLAQQPDEVLGFLLATAGLDRFCASLCEAVLDGAGGERPAQQVLEELEHAGLFLVPLDGQRRWYRYHALFADLLRLRLRRDRPGAAAASHARASRWCEAHGLIDDAIRYALQARDRARAADLIEREGMTMLARLGRPVPKRWLQALPEATVRERPMLAIVHAWALLIRQPMQMADPEVLGAVEARLADAERALRERPGAAPANEVRGHVRLCRAHLARFRGDVAAAIRLSREELDRLPLGPGLFRSGVAFNLGLAYLAAEDGAAALEAFRAAERATAPDNHVVGAGVAYLQAAVLTRQGRLRDAYALSGATLERLAPPDASGTFPSYAGSHYVVRAQILFEWDRLEAAEQQLEAGAEHVRRFGDPLIEARGQGLRARIRYARGDAAGADRTLRDLLQRFPEAELIVRAIRLDHEAAALRSGEADVEAWAAEGEGSFAAVVAQGEWAFAEWLARGRRFVRQRAGCDDFEEPERSALTAALAAQARQAEAGGWMDRALEILVVLALAHEAVGRSEEALAAVERALQRAQPEGYRRRFLAGGQPVARLLYRYVQEADEPSAPLAAYAAELLAAVPEPPMSSPVARPTPSPAAVSPDGHIEPLSPRETEVLHLIAQGLTNQEIAAELFISYETVKVHARNVYQKLDVHGRTKAVARARGLGLLSAV